MFAAIAFVVVLGLLCLFQLALVFGAPWGRFAWGGKHPDRLPTGYRMASAASILIYGLIAALAVDRAGLLSIFPDGFSQVGMWVVFVYLCLGVVMNAVSKSKSERFLMTPVAAILAVLALVIALTGPGERSGDYTIIDNGSGPVLCEGGVMESYPPQCFGTSVVGWDWDAWPHEEANGVRWGDYWLTVKRDGAQVTVVSGAHPGE